MLSNCSEGAAGN